MCIGAVAGAAVDAAFQAYGMWRNPEQKFNWGSFVLSAAMGATMAGVGDVISANVIKAGLMRTAAVRASSAAVSNGVRVGAEMLSGAITGAAGGQLSSFVKRDGFQWLKDRNLDRAYGYQLLEPTGLGASWHGAIIDATIGAAGSWASTALELKWSASGTKAAAAADKLSGLQIENVMVAAGVHPRWPFGGHSAAAVEAARQSSESISGANGALSLALGSLGSGIADGAEEEVESTLQPSTPTPTSQPKTSQKDRGVGEVPSNPVVFEFHF